MVAVICHCCHCFSYLTHPVPHTDKLEERVHRPKEVLHLLDALLPLVSPHDAWAEVIRSLKWHGDQCILCTFLDTYPHLSLAVVVAGSAEIDESHFLLRPDHICKVKRDIVTNSHILFFLETYAADASDVEYCILAMQPWIAWFQCHEIRTDIFFQLGM